jgi:hypothetical protein
MSTIDYLAALVLAFAAARCARYLFGRWRDARIARLVIALADAGKLPRGRSPR